MVTGSGAFQTCLNTALVRLIVSHVQDFLWSELGATEMIPSSPRYPIKYIPDPLLFMIFCIRIRSIPVPSSGSFHEASFPAILSGCMYQRRSPVGVYT